MIHVPWINQRRPFTHADSSELNQVLIQDHCPPNKALKPTGLLSRFLQGKNRANAADFKYILEGMFKEIGRRPAA